MRPYTFILLFCYTFLVGGLTYVQLIKYERYKVMSEQNRLRVIPLLAPRGTIYDRNSKPIVQDKICYNASVIYSQMKDKAALAKVLSRILGKGEHEMLEKLKKARRQPFILSVVEPDIGLDKAIDIEEVSVDYPGLILDVMPKRDYIYGKVASSMIGYLGYINRGEYLRLKHYGYSINDLVGRDGL
ncbi:MAG: hypothetical protein WC482_05775, partial [Candidatus Omnitrophota bacterium]